MITQEDSIRKRPSFQLVSKLLLLFYFNGEIVEVIEEFGKLWSLDVVADDSEEVESIQNTLHIYKVAIKAFVCLGITHLASFIVIPLVAGGRALPYQVWLPEDNFYCYIAVFIIQIYVIVILLFLVCGTDALFIALCGTMGIQCKLLVHKMRKLKADLGEEVIRGTLKECVLHQQHLIS